MALSINSIMLGGLIMAFVLPAMALVSLSLPNPPMYNATQNMTAAFSGVGISIQRNFNGTESALNQQLVTGNSSNPKNFSGSFYNNPTIFQSFAFIIGGFGQVMTDIVYLPYLDFVSMNFITSGLTTLLPGVAVGFITIGINLLYAYMLITILLQGVSMLMKYNIAAAET